MNTPVCDFVIRYAQSGALRLHMPGHKGCSVIGPEALDITEIDGADVLYDAQGVIRESECNASALFGTADTLYSTEGSSLCIRAMLYLIRLYAHTQGREPVVLAGRNAHKVFITGAALLDLDVRWLYPEGEQSLLACPVTAEGLETAIVQHQPAAVYVTSPDYLGNTLDIGALSAVCRCHGVLLAVDNAHGAYLRFLSPSRHPIDLGADICCDSAHKTLPVLTGGAYLHISRTAPALLAQHAQNALALFASTSPSYLILQSLDAANRYLADEFPTALAQTAQQVQALKQQLVLHGYTLAGDEPLKLTIAPKSMGYTGQQLAQRLAQQNIVCEFADPDFVVFMFTPQTSDMQRLLHALLAVQRRAAIADAPPPLPHPQAVMSPHDALFAPQETVSVENAPGRVLASPSVNCPPAIPIAVLGERIDEAVVNCFRYYGITRCCVTI